MSRIAIPGWDDASARSRQVLDNVNKMFGFVPNLQRLMAAGGRICTGIVRFLTHTLIPGNARRKIWLADEKMMKECDHE